MMKELSLREEGGSLTNRRNEGEVTPGSTVLTLSLEFHHSPQTPSPSRAGIWRTRAPDWPERSLADLEIGRGYPREPSGGRKPHAVCAATRWRGGRLSIRNLRDQGWKEFLNDSRLKQSRQVAQPLLDRGTPSPQGGRFHLVHWSPAGSPGQRCICGFWGPTHLGLTPKLCQCP